MNEHLKLGTDTQHIETVVLSVLHQVIPTPDAVISMDTNLFDENLLDSFALIQLIVRLSERFGIDIPPATFDRHEWSTPSSIVASVSKRLAQKPTQDAVL